MGGVEGDWCKRREKKGMSVEGVEGKVWAEVWAKNGGVPNWPGMGMIVSELSKRLR